jgi:hypothetical protein
MSEPSTDPMVRLISKYSMEGLLSYRFGNGKCCKGLRGPCKTLVKFSADQILMNRGMLQNLSKAGRRVWLRTQASSAKDCLTGHMKHFQVQGIPLCLTAFCDLYNITPKTMYNHSNIEVLNDAEAMEYTPRHRRVTQPAIEWLKLRIPHIADLSPTTHFYVLPQSTMNREELLRMYVYETYWNDPEAEDARPLISLSAWYRLLKVRKKTPFPFPL